MQTALRSRLLADATIAGIVGTRVDWGLRPQAKNLPAIRLTKIRMPRAYQMSGAQATQFYRVQVDCFGSTYKAANDLGDAVIAELEPEAGNFLGSFVLGDDDRQEDLDTGPVFTRILDFQIAYFSA